MGSMKSCVPPGFRFHPTDEELVGYYLRKKVASQKIDLDVIRDVDLYRIEPWDLKEKCRIGHEEQTECYFFSRKDRKYSTGTRTNRATLAGFWKATGRDKAIYEITRLIGMRKTLVFYKGRAPRGQKTDWIMHEYRLESIENENGPPQEDGWAVCRAFKKRTTTPTKTTQNCLETDMYFNKQPSGINFIIDPTECLSRKTPQEYLKSHFMCKQEMITDQVLFFDNPDDSFLQLPHLESPSIPLKKRPISEEEANSGAVGNCSDSKCRKIVTDWRALDKFVASQLIREEKLYQGNGEPTTSFDKPPISECMATAFLLLEDDEDEKLHGLLRSSDGPGDVGIYMHL